MPWVETQSTPYGDRQSEWRPGWTDVELAPYAGLSRVFERAPGEYMTPVMGHDWNGREYVERWVAD